jgi:hypothetical protein
MPSAAVAPVPAVKVAAVPARLGVGRRPRPEESDHDPEQHGNGHEGHDCRSIGIV